MKKIFSYFFFFPSFIFLLFSSFFFNFFFQLSAQTGPNTPATIVNDNSYGTVAWTNPGNANASDNFYASAAGLVMGQPTQYLKATNLGFAINPCDDINGIEVRVEWSQTGTAITQDKVYLVVDGTISTTVNKSTGGVLPNPADLVTLFGGAGDPWSQTLKGSDVNKPSFGIAIAVIRSGGGAASTPQIDHVTITLYHSTPPPMSYSSSTVTQVTTLVNPNTQNNQIIRVDVTTNAGCPAIDASSFTFNMNGTTNLADIQNAKLFYTGTNPVFNNDNQLGSTIGIIPGGNFDINGFIQPLKNGTNYFWLAVDVVAGATLGNLIDGECPSLTVDGIARTPTTTAPGGNRTITAPITFTVGNSGETYTTIQSAYNAIPVTPANTYIIDVYSDYNSALETFPISFSNKSNTFKIIVRPALGETGILCAGTLGSQGLWLMDNAQNIVIEGRAGNLGILKEFTVRNTKIAAPYGTAFRIINDSKNIVFSFLNIEAETTSGASLDGIITIGTTTLTNGNDDIKVLNCLLRDLSVGGSGVVPTAGVYSNGTAAKTNDFIKVDSCQFSQGGFPAINIFANSSNATITNNHLYYPGGMTISTAAQGININSGSDHIISGNFIGGTAASCGGVVFNIASGAFAVTGISVSAAGNNIIENNTLSNMRYTTTYNLTSYPLVGINVAGNGNFTVGAPGKGNLIGSMSGTANFRLTQNGTSGEGIGGIINNSTGTVTVAFNNIGAVTQDGSFAGADAVMILSNSGAGSITIDSNIIGSSSAGDNILMSSNSNLFGIYNSGATGMTCTNNTVKYMNYQVLSATTLYGISNTAGPLMCTANILKI